MPTIRATGFCVKIKNSVHNQKKRTHRQRDHKHIYIILDIDIYTHTPYLDEVSSFGGCSTHHDLNDFTHLSWSPDASSWRFGPRHPNRRHGPISCRAGRKTFQVFPQKGAAHVTKGPTKLGQPCAPMTEQGKILRIDNFDPTNKQPINQHATNSLNPFHSSRGTKCCMKSPQFPNQK